jgi:hypothetical protein
LIPGFAERRSADCLSVLTLASAGQKLRLDVDNSSAEVRVDVDANGSADMAVVLEETFTLTAVDSGL